MTYLRLSLVFCLLFLFFSGYGQIRIKLNSSNQDIHDAIINSSVPNNNNGQTDNFTLYAWTHSGTLVNSRSFIKFQFDDLPKKHELIYAKLVLKYDSNSVYGANVGNNNKFWVERVASTWNENDINWNNQPNVSEINRVGFISDDFIDEYNIDVTVLVKDMIELDRNFGFRLSYLEENIVYKQNIFGSSEHADSTLHPSLVLYFEDNISSSSNLEYQDILEVYPNPSNGKILIQSDIDIYSIELFDLLGRQVDEFSSINDIEIKSSGTYYLRFRTKKGLISRKVLVY